MSARISKIEARSSGPGFIDVCLAISESTLQPNNGRKNKQWAQTAAREQIMHIVSGIISGRGSVC